mmetsp:Transcript_471/g.842  ORF Transcript_471/g.842 Transcript_471/m.842 type:complete len:385 (-) Transcript_471:73-1227(-)
MMVAFAVPPPSQIANKPYLLFSLSRVLTRVVISFAPVHPRGWPSAIAPPFTLSFLASAFTPFSQAIGTDANASFTSNTSMSSMVILAFFSTARVAGIGPSSMILGSLPAKAIATIRALGRAPSLRSPASFASSRAAAPSEIWDAAAAVITPVGFLLRGFSFLILSRLGLNRTPSSCSCTTTEPLFLSKPCRGMISLLKCPFLIAEAAFLCDSSANKSISSRFRSYFFARSSAPMNWLNRDSSPYFSWMPRERYGCPWFRPTLDPIGTVDITSTPPAMTMSCVSDITACAAKCSACCPEPHCRSTVTPGVVIGSFLDDNTTLRPTFALCAPTWLTQPKMTSSTRAPSKPTRSTSASHTVAPRSAGCHLASRPLRRPAAVRTQSTM